MSRVLRKKWGEDCSKALVGKTIKEVRYLTEEEADGLGWDRCSLVISLDDGTFMYPSQDDEGNGPGALFTNIDKLETIPAI